MTLMLVGGKMLNRREMIIATGVGTLGLLGIQTVNEFELFEKEMLFNPVNGMLMSICLSDDIKIKQKIARLVKHFKNKYGERVECHYLDRELIEMVESFKIQDGIELAVCNYTWQVCGKRKIIICLTETLPSRLARPSDVILHYDDDGEFLFVKNRNGKVSPKAKEYWEERRS